MSCSLIQYFQVASNIFLLVSMQELHRISLINWNQNRVFEFLLRKCLSYKTTLFQLTITGAFFEFLTRLLFQLHYSQRLINQKILELTNLHYGIIGGFADCTFGWIQVRYLYRFIPVTRGISRGTKRTKVPPPNFKKTTHFS